MRYCYPNCGKNPQHKFWYSRMPVVIIEWHAIFDVLCKQKEINYARIKRKEMQTM